MGRFVLYVAVLLAFSVGGQVLIRMFGMPADVALMIGWFLGWMSCAIRDLLLEGRADG